MNLWGYTIKLVNSREADVYCPANSDFSQRESFRVVLTNPTQWDSTFNIALPWGNDYRLAYRWQFHYPTTNCGPAKIAKRMKESSFSLYTADGNLAEVIYYAGREIMKAYRSEK